MLLIWLINIYITIGFRYMPVLEINKKVNYRLKNVLMNN